MTTAISHPRELEVFCKAFVLSCWQAISEMSSDKLVTLVELSMISHLYPDRIATDLELAAEMNLTLEQVEDVVWSLLSSGVLDEDFNRINLTLRGQSIAERVFSLTEQKLKR